jgi:hypothetical protein
MKAMINDPCRILEATARFRDDGLVIYSQEGLATKLFFQPEQLHKLEMQLERNGAFPENIEKFLGSLLRTGLAEIRQPKLITKFRAL